MNQTLYLARLGICGLLFLFPSRLGLIGFSAFFLSLLIYRLVGFRGLFTVYGMEAVFHGRVYYQAYEAVWEWFTPVLRDGTLPVSPVGIPVLPLWLAIPLLPVAVSLQVWLIWSSIRQVLNKTRSIVQRAGRRY